MNRSHQMTSSADADSSRLRPPQSYRPSPVEEHDAARSAARKVQRRDVIRRAEADEEIRALMNAPRAWR